MIKVLKISETVLNGLKQDAARGILTEKTKSLVGISGKIVEFNCTILEGEAWEKKRSEMMAKDPVKFGFMANMKYSVSGTINLGGKTAYLNAALLGLLIKAGVLESTDMGYIPKDVLIKIHANFVEVLKTSTEPTVDELLIKKGFTVEQIGKMNEETKQEGLF